MWEFLSLDSVMEAPEKWVFPYQSEDLAEAIKAQAIAAEALVLGKVTHHEFGFVDKLNTQAKVVVSSTRTRGGLEQLGDQLGSRQRGHPPAQTTRWRRD